MLKISVELHVESYIADPYWPEREQVIDVQKKSGANNTRSGEDTREKKLRAYLDKIGMSVKEYEELKVKAERPWYTKEDGTIFVPRHQMSGCFVQACATAPAGAKFKQEEFRTLVRIDDFVTDRTKEDRWFERYVRPMGPNGKVLSNQRTLRRNPVIENFVAAGILTINENEVKMKSLHDLMKYAGRYIGLGASRKMGYGRFEVESFIERKEAA